jgi:hypothetical protein
MVRGLVLFYLMSPLQAGMTRARGFWQPVAISFHSDAVAGVN